jgi:hypothetical protein
MITTLQSGVLLQEHNFIWVIFKYRVSLFISLLYGGTDCIHRDLKGAEAEALIAAGTK